MEPVLLIQMNIYQSNTYGKDLSWLHLDSEPRVAQEGGTVIQICSSSLWEIS